MKRRDFMSHTAGLGMMVAVATLPGPFGAAEFVEDAVACVKNAAAILGAAGNKLVPPTKGKIPVAVAISQGVTVIDFAGPWEVFQDVHIEERGKEMDEQMPFQLFTVAEKAEPIIGSGGLRLLPDYTFSNAPQPKVIVVPAQKGSDALHEWLRNVSPATDVTMSVCTGAYQLAKAGLLAGKSATTHHEFVDRFAKMFPDVDVKRGLRFVENEKISTAGGLSSGIDLALRVVDRYFGRNVAEATAGYMEYQGKGWIV
jgi:transcriptional regulator GlxA family with amidase domain